MSIVLQYFSEFNCTSWCVLRSYAIWSRPYVQLCCERYGKYMSDLLHMPPKQKLNITIDKDVKNRVGTIKELVMVRDDLMSVYGVRLSCADVRVPIDLICSYYVLFCVFIFHFYFILVSFYIHVSCLTVYVYYGNLYSLSKW